ncbi:hypothetical protein ACFW3D_21010 [Streptomyces sp. NPDC058864]
MERPRRDDGFLEKLDRRMPYVGLATGLYLAVQGIRLYLRGSSAFWALGGAVIVVLASWDIYKHLRTRRDRAASESTAPRPSPSTPAQ